MGIFWKILATVGMLLAFAAVMYFASALANWSYDPYKWHEARGPIAATTAMGLIVILIIGIVWIREEHF